MKLENQVTSLELSKKLNELGVKQESIWVWHDSAEAGEQLVELKNESKLAQQFGDWISAFTVAELGEMLPKGYVIGHTFKPEEEKAIACHWYLIEDKTGKALDLGYNHKAPYDKMIYADTEANARAKMLIYLLENKLI